MGPPLRHAHRRQPRHNIISPGVVRDTINRMQCLPEGVVAVNTYTVRAKRWEHGWELHIDGVGVTQSHGLKDAEMMARDLISRRLGVPEDAFSVEITPEIGGGLDERATAARAAVHAAASAQQKAAAQSREAARMLHRAGLTGRDIAAVLQVSPQRVSQLLRDQAGGTGEDAEATRYATG